MAQQVRLYEFMYILDPGLSPEEVEEVMTSLKDALEEVGGEFHADYEWARRRLAYRIKGFGEGIFRIIYFDAVGIVGDQLLKHAAMDTRIIRAMVFVANPKTIFRPREPMPEEPVAEEGAAPEEGAEVEGAPVEEGAVVEAATEEAAVEAAPEVVAEAAPEAAPEVVEEAPVVEEAVVEPEAPVAEAEEVEAPVAAPEVEAEVEPETPAEPE
jgi:ribosomal protein S6